MITTDLDDLIGERGRPCVSVIVPTYRLAPERMQNGKILRKALRRAGSRLGKYPASREIRQSIRESLDSMSGAFDPVHAWEGLGLFASPGVARMMKFPFPVREKVIVGDTFETRDVFYLKQYLSRYYILTLSKKNIQLFSAVADSLEEVKDDHFPMQYEDTYEYSPPSRGSSYGNSLKGFEKDKSILSAIRVKALLKEAGSRLSGYLSEPGSRFILAGIKTLVNDFKQATHLSGYLAGEVTGSFNRYNMTQLTESAWQADLSCRKNETRQLICRLQEEKDKGRMVQGLHDVWEAASEGKGQLLLVEKDYRCSAYLKKKIPQTLFFDPPEGEYTLIADAVDDLIETVNQKKGGVVFAEDGWLENLDRIAMLLRYDGSKSV